MPFFSFFYSKLASTRAWVNLSQMPFSASKKPFWTFLASHIKPEYLPASLSHHPNFLFLQILISKKSLLSPSQYVASLWNKPFPPRLHQWKPVADCPAVNSHQHSQLYGLLQHLSRLFTEGQRTNSLCFVSFIIKLLQEPLILPPDKSLPP